MVSLNPILYMGHSKVNGPFPRYHHIARVEPRVKENRTFGRQAKVCFRSWDLGFRALDLGSRVVATVEGLVLT